jgi:hypothetical protein
MRAIVSKYATGNSDIRFSTPTAVAGVRGTHLVVEFDHAAKKTVVSVLEGSVAFRSLQQSPGSEVVLGALQQSSQVGTQGRPSSPATISQADMQQLGTEINDQTPGAEPKNDQDSRQEGDAPSGEDSNSGANPGGDADEQGASDSGDGASAVDQNLQRIDAAGQAGTPASEHNPASNPAADTGIRVRW